MNDTEIMQHIKALVDEEHTLDKKASEHGGLSEEERDRVLQLNVSLDQCWDLLRQRRARREFGENPDEAKVRDAAVVESYNQ